MQQTDATAEATSAMNSSEHVRFVLLCRGRTGSTMLGQALNSSPAITCFGAIFNKQLDFVDFSVDGYDNISAPDMELRDRDALRFVRERVFSGHPPETQAVGFKYAYGQAAQFPGLLECLVEDEALRVVHLRRRNLLRSFVSSRIVEQTGVWFSKRPPTFASKFTLQNGARAVRHPVWAARSILAALRSRRRDEKSPKSAVTLSQEECTYYFDTTERIVEENDQLFRGHPKLTVVYEDMAGRSQEAFVRAQSFLGVEPQPLTVATRRQNPEPLRELIENYDELYEAFKDTPREAFFE